jgi:2-polyprenyl-3-methyl-5-hydroxy-6-metoxy-1,4-benzoquinol methylase
MIDDGVGRAEEQESLEAMLKGEVLRMYQEVADHPEAEFHFHHGREAAERFCYSPEWLDRAPAGAVVSFAGVGNPHERSAIKPGETVLDLGSGAGLDAIIAGWQTGSGGRVIGLDLNPSMCHKAKAHAEGSGTARSTTDSVGGILCPNLTLRLATYEGPPTQSVGFCVAT